MAQIARSVTVNGTLYGFYEFTPSGYNQSDNTKKYPVIIWLHGGGERGNGTTELSSVLAAGIPKYINAGATMTFTNPGNSQSESFIVLSPQLPASSGAWTDNYVEDMITYAKTTLQGDGNRVYLAGLHLGGQGIMHYIGANSTQANKIAAATFAAGICDTNTQSVIVNSHLPFWGFVTDLDFSGGGGYSCLNSFVDGLNTAGITPTAKKTVYSGADGGIDINSWDRGYSQDHSVQNPNVYEWMLGYSRTGQSANNAPTVTLPANITITLPTNSTTITGTASDSDGTIASYAWTKVSGGAATFVSPSAASTQITNLVQGVYVFRLTATDNLGATGSATIQVTVNAAAVNNPPVANAGVDQTVTLPTNSTTVTGSGSDSDGTITGYAWTQISGPTTVTFGTAAASSTTVNNLAQGTYVLRLTVTDNGGSTGTDDIQITVNAAAGAGALTQVSFVASGGTTIPFYKFLPAGYSTAKQYPVIIFLHGAGEKGDGSLGTGGQLKNVLNAGLPKLLNQGASMVFTNPNTGVSESFIVLAPQLPSQYGGWIDVYTDELYNYAVNNLSVDLNKFYLTGLSLGGGGTQHYVSQSLANANKFAAIATAAGICDYSSLQSLADANLKAWTFMNNQDFATPGGGPSCATGFTNTLNGLKAGLATLTLYSAASNDHNAWDKAYDLGHTVQNPNVYEFMLANARSGVVSNSAPVVTASSAQVITLPTSSVSLTSSATDSDGTIASYAWTKVSGGAATITSPNSQNTTITGLVAGSYVFRITATDNGGATGSKTVSVTVNASGTPATLAGYIKSSTVNTFDATTNDACSQTNLVTPVYTSGGTIANNTFAYSDSGLTTPFPGGYKFWGFSLSSGGAASKSFTIDGGDGKITLVNNCTVAGAVTANAGTDITITLPTSVATLTGSATTTAGTITTYAWAKVSGPTGGTIASPSAATTNVTALAQGTYVFRLTATDSNSVTGSDTVSVIVNAAGPTKLAGYVKVASSNPLDAVNNNACTQTNLTTPIYTSDGLMVENAFAYSDNALTTPFPGNYQYWGFTTTNGGVATNKMSIEAGNGKVVGFLTCNIIGAVPVAHAGVDQFITLPTSTVTLSGSGTDSDGSVTAYAWTKVSGPSGGTITSPSTASTTITGLLEGTYVYRLTVTDNSTNTGTDDVTIIVSPATSDFKINILEDYVYDLTGHSYLGGGGNIYYLFNGNLTDHANPYRVLQDPTNGLSVWDREKGIRAVIDLGNGNNVKRHITRIKFYDRGFSNADCWIRNADSAFEDADKLTGYTKLINTSALPEICHAITQNGAGTGGKTQEFVVDVTARYIIVQLKNFTVDFSEIEFYSPDTNGTPVAITYTDSRSFPNMSFSEKLGTNFSAKYPLSYFKAVPNLREYYLVSYFHNDTVNAYPNNIIDVNPFPNAGVEYDKQLTDAGFIVRPSFRGPASHLTTQATSLGLTIDANYCQPVNNLTNDCEDPHSYTELANFYYMFMGVNGFNTAFNPAHVRAKPSWDGNVGKGVYRYFEDGNEDESPLRNHQLIGSHYIGGFTNPLMYFARAYANKNGWGGHLGAQMGAVTADPNMKYVMQGLIDLEVGWIKVMAFLCKNFTYDGQFLWDVINVHSYPRNLVDKVDFASPTADEWIGVRRITSDEANFRTVLENFRKECSRFIGSKSNSIEWGLTEIGADINQSTPTTANEFNAQYTVTATPVYEGLDNLQSQAVTLFRDYRHFNATKWNFLNQYVFENPFGVQNSSVQNFGTSGLFTNTAPASGTKNFFPSWYFHAQIEHYLSNYTYSSTLNEGKDLPVVDKYVHKTDNTKAAYIVYRGSLNNLTGNFNIPVTANSAQRVTLSYSAITGTEATQLITNNILVTTPTVTPQLFFIGGLSASNIAPTANAGVDQVVILPTSSSTLIGTGSDSDGSIASYAWSKIGGPTGGTITSPTQATTGITGLGAGTYTYQLIVTDNLGATGTDTVTVTVNTPANQPPIVNAGADQIITLPTNSVSLVSTSSDPDGSIQGYSWTKSSGPSTGTITTPTASNTTVTGLVAGVYNFTLTVTDNNGTTASDTVQVIVNSISGGPTLDAGVGKVGAVSSSVVLSASATPLSGTTITSYTWVQLSGPVTAIISGGTTATPTISAMTQPGVYLFRVTAQDSGGGSASDTIAITTVPPIASDFKTIASYLQYLENGVIKTANNVLIAKDNRGQVVAFILDPNNQAELINYTRQFVHIGKTFR